jgi:hypothetical protein|tara:strand:- start:8921 stop:9307 length:387 start_codon:yes stop_codon:yes gene_type:complete
MKNILVTAALVLVALYGIIITISYVDINAKKVEMYDQIPVTKDPNQAIAVKDIDEHSAGSGLEYRYEIRVQNDYDNERLEMTTTIESAIDYLKQYKRFHDDLYVYNMITGELVTHSRRIVLNDSDNEQ